ncbi:PorP/SprF family type IX secretion system membrane protein [Pseudoflavitalea sp. X16]|uniref:PorP/SprF family type IX secretion system membrane protein n=1 Tax=Paraflavitalea devenefica TaxID=2716334 RepID=UPI00141FA8BD|nr:PorP/SprF family type IX secretion system membrane protein [Paraflavitalea devenefica]NII27753.1 PorP/SprF family type IX secretion system membrane protein [Paraflavitalea devenefica]
MKQQQILKSFLFLLILPGYGFTQDPSFSQFFSSPLNINPGLTANINGKWRLITNIRDQWIGPASPYATGTISYDSKIMKDKLPETSTFGLGGMLMYDYAMSGIHKSIYASLNVSYNITLARDAGDHRFGIGVGGIYGSKTIDFDRLVFGEQFTGHGFNTNLPTGEAALINMKPYISSSAGATYSYTTDYSNIDLGVAFFHLNKPKQTFLNDPHQYLAMRKVVHANFETRLNNNILFNANGIYQYQSAANYFSIGGALGFFIDETGDDQILNLGVWYWSKNAIIPYIGMRYKSLQFGFTYDITISKLSEAERKPKTFEVSFIIRGDDNKKGYIWCPWK